VVALGSGRYSEVVVSTGFTGKLKILDHFWQYEYANSQIKSPQITRAMENFSRPGGNTLEWPTW
jgi:hypothetical protein